jgi:hypothetical protein
MSFGHRQLDTLHSDVNVVQFRIGFWHKIDEPSIQTAGSDGFQLFQARRRLKLQYCVGPLLSESAEGIRNNAAPGCILCESYAQRP